MKEYRLNTCTPSVNKFIAEYIAEKGIDVKGPSGSISSDFPYWYIGDHISAVSQYHSSTPIGIDEFLKKVDEFAAKPKVVKISPLSNNPTTIEPNGDIKVGCTTIPEKEVKRFIKEYTKRVLPEKEFYLGGDFFMNENEDIYMLIYSGSLTVQLVALNGGNRYKDPIRNHGGKVDKELLLKFSGDHPMVHIKNPYQ